MQERAGEEWESLACWWGRVLLPSVKWNIHQADRNGDEAKALRDFAASAATATTIYTDGSGGPN